MTRVRYEILEKEKDKPDKWRLVTKAEPVKQGWLHYQIRTKKDGTVVGLARPGYWRAREVK